MTPSSTIFAPHHPVERDVDDVPSPTTAMAYRRRARQLRGRLRKDPVALHLSLKQLAKEADAAGPAASAIRHGVAPARRVVSREVAAGLGTIDPVADRIATENRAAAASPAFATKTIAAGLNVPVEAVDRFGDRVREMLAEGVLRHDQRKSLMREATRLGLGKFEASLVIAAVEHRYRTSYAVAPPVRSSSVGTLVGALLLIEVVLLSLWIGFCC